MKSFNFEGGTNGATITAADTGSGDPWDVVTGPPSGGVLQYVTSSIGHGAMAGRVANRATGGSSNLEWNAPTPAASFGGRIYFWIDDIAASLRLCQMRESISGSSIASLWITFISGNWYPSLRTSTDVAVYLFNHNQTTLAINTLYRLEYVLTVNGASAPTIQGKLFLGDATVEMEDSGAVAGTSSGTATTWGHIRHGIIDAGAVLTNNPSATGSLFFDDIAAFAPTFPGPLTTLQYARPSADVAAGGWTPTPGSPTTLFDKIDDVTVDDTNYISATAS